MAIYIGIDTSNYTSSLAAFDSKSKKVINIRQMLEVKQGERGLRQNEAVFQHSLNIPQLIDKLFTKINEKELNAVSASISPRCEAGSYMPCFIVGSGVASILSSALKLPLHNTSHQTGHILAALFSAKRLDLINEKFIAFHVSGGTTEALLVSPDKENIIKTRIIAKTLDLNAGQAIDRVGVAMGLGFPAGAMLDKLAQKSKHEYKPKVVLKGNDCCLSGLENLCLKIIEENSAKEDVAKYCIDYISTSLEKMTISLLKEHGKLPLLFSGGVMANSLIQQRFKEKFSVFFAKPEFSADNAAGIAIYGYLKENSNEL